MTALIVKAEQAQPKDQCFLYAELVHEMTELAGQQLNAGDGDHASATLKMVQDYAEKIHTGLCRTALKSRNFAFRPRLLHLNPGNRNGLCTLIPDERTCSGTVKSVNDCVHVDEVPS
jgi:hypothetical protein